VMNPVELSFMKLVVLKNESCVHFARLWVIGDILAASRSKLNSTGFITFSFQLNRRNRTPGLSSNPCRRARLVCSSNYRLDGIYQSFQRWLKILLWNNPVLLYFCLEIPAVWGYRSWYLPCSSNFLSERLFGHRVTVYSLRIPISTRTPSNSILTAVRTSRMMASIGWETRLGLHLFVLEIPLVIRQTKLLTLSCWTTAYFRLIPESVLSCRIITRLTTFKITGHRKSLSSTRRFWTMRCLPLDLFYQSCSW